MPSLAMLLGLTAGCASRPTPKDKVDRYREELQVAKRSQQFFLKDGRVAVGELEDIAGSDPKKSRIRLLGNFLESEANEVSDDGSERITVAEINQPVADLVDVTGRYILINSEKDDILRKDAFIPFPELTDGLTARFKVGTDYAFYTQPDPVTGQSTHEKTALPFAELDLHAKVHQPQENSPGVFCDLDGSIRFASTLAQSTSEMVSKATMVDAGALVYVGWTRDGNHSFPYKVGVLGETSHYFIDDEEHQGASSANYNTGVRASMRYDVDSYADLVWGYSGLLGAQQWVVRVSLPANLSFINPSMLHFTTSMSQFYQHGEHLKDRDQLVFGVSLVVPFETFQSMTQGMLSKIFTGGK